jgi:hypothetical protein
LFPADPTDAQIDWLDSDHVICVYCRLMSVPQLFKQVTEFIQGSYEECRMQSAVCGAVESTGMKMERVLSEL